MDSGERRTSDNRHPSRSEGAASKADAPRPGAHETTPTPRFAAPGTQIGPTPGAESLEGRRILGVGDGFGETWFKRFTVNLGHAEPEEVMTVWKREFSRLWPQEAAFRAHGARIVPGAVAEVELDGPVGTSRHGSRGG